MKASKFLSNYLKAEDLEDQPPQRLTISKVTAETVGIGSDAETKLVVYFKEVEQGVVINKTNGEWLKMMFGDETDDWVGRIVMLEVKQVAFKGKQVPGLRLAEAK